jgi:biopolymer transport protein TolQ
MPPGGQRLSPHYATDAARDRVRSERQEPAMDPTQAPIEAAHDFSFLGLFLQADPIVKGVMILLVIATLVRSGGSLDGDHRGIAGHVVKAAIDAWRDQDSSETRAERRERIERAMKGALTLEMKRLRTGLSLLATSGSTAPFVGLFGTVWGIMNSFSSIARSQDTSLAVVAPGIAEALFATAIGLVVAIPAVMAYNKLAADIGGVQSTFGSYISVLGNRLARDRAGAHRAAAE